LHLIHRLGYGTDRNACCGRGCAHSIRKAYLKLRACHGLLPTFDQSLAKENEHLGRVSPGGLGLFGVLSAEPLPEPKGVRFQVFPLGFTERP